MADFIVGGHVDPASHQRTGTTANVESGDLTTHGVIVGMTGSGKTGLGIVLIEEALQAAIPTLLIDPKGDLTNLCLTFPNLAATDFEPWVNEGDAHKAGLSVPEFAAAQAKTWTDGLAGWGMGAADVALLRDNAEFTIYTPGSSSGVGLNIVGSLQAPADTSDSEVIGDETESFTSGLLGLVGIEADPLSSREHILLCNLIVNEWTAGRSPDLAGLIAMIQDPPLRKLGVFDLDAFFPAKHRTDLAIRLNGLLASPSFAAWLTGPSLDIDTMLRTVEGNPRCAIVCTAHLGDQERQFVTTLILSKLVTWMRRQTGTSDLRALLYMDEVAGYLPPSAMPPTKKPIMTLIKQARAFGLGVVLSTQNPVDIDYKALSNAGTWMIGRLQTERDKLRLLDGMSSAAGGVDVGAIGDTISGLAKREFVLRRTGTDQPEVFSTRWAMSYLRGPLTRDQIATLMADQKAASTATGSAPPADAGALPAPVTIDPATVDPATVDPDSTLLMPGIASGIAVRWADLAAPWLAAIGADPTGTRREPAVVARISLRYDDTKADLIHDEEYEAVIFPLDDRTDATRSIGIDYDDRDLRVDPPPSCTYVLSRAPLQDKSYWSRVERDLIDHLVRNRSLEIVVNRELKLYSRPGETAEAFGIRAYQAADARADHETAKLRDRYETKVTRIRNQLLTAEDRAELLETQRDGRRDEELLSTAGSILGGLLGGRRSRGGLLGTVLGKAGTSVGRRSRTNASAARLDAAENKVDTLRDHLEDLEAELSDEVFEIDTRWNVASKNLTKVVIALERSDVKVTQLSLVWIPRS